MVIWYLFTSLICYGLYAFDKAAATATEAYAAADAAHNEVKAAVLEVYKASAALEVYKASAAIKAYEARKEQS